jgi:hypothetical protein
VFLNVVLIRVSRSLQNEKPQQKEYYVITKFDDNNNYNFSEFERILQIREQTRYISKRRSANIVLIWEIMDLSVKIAC